MRTTSPDNLVSQISKIKTKIRIRTNLDNLLKTSGNRDSQGKTCGNQGNPAKIYGSLVNQDNLDRQIKIRTNPVNLDSLTSLDNQVSPDNLANRINLTNPDNLDSLLNLDSQVSPDNLDSLSKSISLAVKKSQFNQAK